MNLGIQNKVALVTGAGGGLGRAIALELAQEGAKVVVASRNEAQIRQVVTQMGGAKKGHFGLAIDLMEPNGPGDIVAAARKAVGDIDIVVNNVGGTMDINDPLCSLADWRRIWRFNMEIAIEINQMVIPAMREKHWGRIVHISSISGAENHGPVPYCSVKAALIAYTRSLGRVVAPDGIIITALLPGAVFTEGGYWDEASKNRPEHVEKYLQERMAIHRFGKTEEISGLAAFLCSQQASFCVGSIVPVDGGQGRTFFGV